MTVAGARPVFVLGTGRCGSTLVHEVLARHHQCGFVTNIDDLGLAVSTRRQNDFWRRLPASVTDKGGARFAPSEAYRVIEREVGPVLVDPVRDLHAADATPWLANRLHAFVAKRAARLDSDVFLHKFTGWPRAGLLAAVFPDARYIEVVRDGRAVTNSWLQMPWWRGYRGPQEWHFGPLPPELDELWQNSDQSFAVLAALAWRMLVSAHIQARRHIDPDRWLVIRYEDVVHDPRTQMQRMLDHMSLPLDAPFEKGLDRYTFSPSRLTDFQRDLGPATVEQVERVIGDQLHTLGYQ